MSIFNNSVLKFKDGMRVGEFKDILEGLPGGDNVKIWFGESLGVTEVERDLLGGAVVINLTEKKGFTVSKLLDNLSKFDDSDGIFVFNLYSYLEEVDLYYEQVGDDGDEMFAKPKAKYFYGYIEGYDKNKGFDCEFQYTD